MNDLPEREQDPTNQSSGSCPMRSSCGEAFAAGVTFAQHAERSRRATVAAGMVFVPLDRYRHGHNHRLPDEQEWAEMRRRMVHEVTDGVVGLGIYSLRSPCPVAHSRQVSVRLGGSVRLRRCQRGFARVACDSSGVCENLGARQRSGLLPERSSTRGPCNSSAGSDESGVVASSTPVPGKPVPNQAGGSSTWPNP